MACPIGRGGKGVPSPSLPTTPSQCHQVQLGSDAVGRCSSGRKLLQSSGHVRSQLAAGTKQPPESESPGSPTGRDLSQLSAAAEFGGKATHGGDAVSQAVPAQSHLSLAEVAAGAQAPVLGVVAGAAEEQRLLLEVALADALGHRRVQVVHLELGAVARDAEPGGQGKEVRAGERPAGGHRRVLCFLGRFLC